MHASQRTSARKPLWLSFCLMLLTAWAVGYLFLCAMFAIPGERAYRNAVASTPLFQEEGIPHYVVATVENSSLDNYSDMWFTNIAANTAWDEEQSFWTRAIDLPYVAYSNFFQPLENWVTYVTEPETPVLRYSYGRYWGGSMALMRLMYTLWDYRTTRVCNLVCQLLLLAVTLGVALRRHGWRPAALVALAYLAFYPPSLWQSWNFVPCYYISMGGMLYMLLRRRSHTPWLAFAVLGMLTSFFDVLTYPMATVGLPLLLYLTTSRSTNPPPQYSFAAHSHGLLPDVVCGLPVHVGG